MVMEVVLVDVGTVFGVHDKGSFHAPVPKPEDTVCENDTKGIDRRSNSINLFILLS